MIRRTTQLFFLISSVAAGCLGVHAQCNMQGTSLFPRHDPAEDLPRRNPADDMPRNLRETCEKMRIEKEKKDHDEMLERGEELRKLAERLGRSFAQNGRLSDDDRAALEAVERDAKKIRDQLGGGDDDENIDDVLGRAKTASFANAVDALRSAAANLSDELKKTTRFSISATAIQSSNAVLTVARFLRIRN